MLHTVMQLSAAKNLATTIGSGFEGLVLDPTNGMRLFHPGIKLYSGSDLTLDIDSSDGIKLLVDSVDFSNPERYVTWYDDLDPLGNEVADIGA